MNTIVTVVLYNKNIEDSLTLNRLCEIGDYEYEICIINNGPHRIEKKNILKHEFFNNVKGWHFFEYLNNAPLSFIYNKVIESFEHCDRFVFLDDDSQLSLSFFSDLNSDIEENGMMDLQVPKIEDLKTKKIFYPRYNGVEISDEYKHNSNEKCFFYTIGSGLVVYVSLVKKIKKYYGEVFDPRFALYGVDVSLFRRIKAIEQSGESVSIGVVSIIKHSLSRTEEKISDWRYKERLYDSILSTKYYSRNFIYKVYHLTRIVYLEVMSGKISNIPIIITTYFNGKHPRC